MLSGKSYLPVIKEEVTQIFVVVGSGRSVDNNTTEDSVPSLNSEMTVVPR